MSAAKSGAVVTFYPGCRCAHSGFGPTGEFRIAVIASSASDEAIHFFARRTMDCFASLAMTD
jgi:hypothetical protein